jgi:hypothetical protein
MLNFSVYDGKDPNLEKYCIDMGKFINDVKRTKKRLQDLEIKEEILEAIFFKRIEILNEFKNRV